MKTIAKNVSTPLTDTTQRNNSPYQVLNRTKIVPTFIMHGEGMEDDSTFISWPMQYFSGL